MSRKDVLHSPHLAERKKQRQKVLLRKTILVLLLLVAGFVGLGFLSRWSKMNIGDIQITGNKVADTDTMTELVQQEISGHYLWFFPKSNFLLYPKGHIESSLREQFKILDDISINVENTRTLRIAVTERTPVYMWCGATLPALGATSTCYFMDDSGYIYSVAPYFSGDAYFKFYGPLGPDGTEPIGSYFLPDLFANVVTFFKDTKNIGLDPVALLASDDENQNIDLYLSGATPPPDAPEIIFKRNFDVEKTAENLQTALSTEPLRTDFKKKYSSLQYIDLGFGDKVYFKFK